MHFGKAFLAAAVALVLSATPLAAEPKSDQFYVAFGGGPGPGPMGMPGQFMRRVVIQAGPSPFMMLLGAAKLTPAQQAQVQAIMQSKSADNEQLMTQLHAIEEQISNRLLSPEPVGASDLAPLEKQAADIKQKMDQNMVDTSLAIRNVLTRDQLKRLVEVRKQLESLRAQIQALVGGPLPLPGMPVP